MIGDFFHYIINVSALVRSWFIWLDRCYVLVHKRWISFGRWHGLELSQKHWYFCEMLTLDSDVQISRAYQWAACINKYRMYLQYIAKHIFPQILTYGASKHFLHCLCLMFLSGVEYAASVKHECTVLLFLVFLMLFLVSVPCLLFVSSLGETFTCSVLCRLRRSILFFDTNFFLHYF